MEVLKSANKIKNYFFRIFFSENAEYGDGHFLGVNLYIWVNKFYY